jgi:hypothetical protein
VSVPDFEDWCAHLSTPLGPRAELAAQHRGDPPADGAEGSR